MEVILGSSAVVVDDAGRILLVQRGKEPAKGRWTVPGGHVEPGERPPDGAVREALEETGLELRVIRELWTIHAPAGEGRVYEASYHLAELVGGELRAGDDAADARWVPLDELGTLPLTRGLVDQLRAAGILPATTSA